MSMLAPVSACSALMFLPPGPISLPIFSGSILTVSRRGAHLLISLRGAGQRLGHLVEDHQPGFFGAVQGVANDLVVDAFDLDVELDGGDAVAGAADFEVHVAEVIFLADDVGEEGRACRLP